MAQIFASIIPVTDLPLLSKGPVYTNHVTPRFFPLSTPVLDWFHIAMRFEHALQAARGFGAGTSSVYLRSHPIRELESSKWKLWHGRAHVLGGWRA